MIGFNPSITLHANGLNTPIKKQRLSCCVKRQDKTICYLQETCFKYKKNIKFKNKRMQNMYPANSKYNYINIRDMTRDKKECFVMIKG